MASAEKIPTYSSLAEPPQLPSCKDSNSEEAARTPGCQSNWKGEKLIFLESFKDDFLNASNKGKFYCKITLKLFEKYGYSDNWYMNPTPGVDLESLCPVPIDKIVEPEEWKVEAARRSGLVKKVQEVIGQWYHHKYKSRPLKMIINKLVNGLIAAVCLRPPRKQSAVQLYNERNWVTKLKEGFDIYWVALPEDKRIDNRKATKQNKWVKDHFDAEPEAIRAQLVVIADKEHESAMAEWKRNLKSVNAIGGSKETWELARVLVPVMMDAMAEWTSARVTMQVIACDENHPGKMKVFGAQSDISLGAAKELISQVHAPTWADWLKALGSYAETDYFSRERKFPNGSVPAAKNNDKREIDSSISVKKDIMSGEGDVPESDTRIGVMRSSSNLDHATPSSTTLSKPSSTTSLPTSKENLVSDTALSNGSATTVSTTSKVNFASGILPNGHATAMWSPSGANFGTSSPRLPHLPLSGSSLLANGTHTNQSLASGDYGVSHEAGVWPSGDWDDASTAHGMASSPAMYSFMGPDFSNFAPTNSMMHQHVTFPLDMTPMNAFNGAGFNPSFTGMQSTHLSPENYAMTAQTFTPPAPGTVLSTTPFTVGNMSSTSMTQAAPLTAPGVVLSMTPHAMGDMFSTSTTQAAPLTAPGVVLSMTPCAVGDMFSTSTTPAAPPPALKAMLSANPHAANDTSSRALPTPVPASADQASTPSEAAPKTKKGKMKGKKASARAKTENKLTEGAKETEKNKLATGKRKMKSNPTEPADTGTKVLRTSARKRKDPTTSSSLTDHEATGGDIIQPPLKKYRGYAWVPVVGEEGANA